MSLEGMTEGYPLGMAMYTLATVPLINKIQSEGNCLVWYADDAAAGGKLSSIRQWWQKLDKLVPNFG